MAAASENAVLAGRSSLDTAGELVLARTVALPVRLEYAPLAGAARERGTRMPVEPGASRVESARRGC